MTETYSKMKWRYNILIEDEKLNEAATMLKKYNINTIFLFDRP